MATDKAELLQRLAKLSPKQLAFLVVELQEKVEAERRESGEPVAVVGMGCRFPGASGPDEFWTLLRDGVDAIREVPPDRWDVDAYYDPDPEVPGKMYTRWGGFVDGIDRFEPQFFGISPREAATMDPQQRLALEVAWEALEHGAINPASLMRARAGVFMGVSGNDYAARAVGDGSLDGYVGTGNAPSVVAGRLAYVFGLQGPCLSVDTACSSSLVAVHLACKSLRDAECDVALAGGVSVILAPETNVILSRAGMMARDGRCKTFDASADGYVRGEGCGIVVLKRLSDALRDGNRVLAVVRGTAVNQDGRSNGLTAPNGQAQQALLREALSRSGLAAPAIDYIEAHGTGTSLGDPIELQAIGAVLGEGRAPERPVRVGSVKTNIGHLEAAAGVAGLIKVVLSLEHGELSPHLHFKDPNPLVPWSALPVSIVTTRTPWRRSAEARRAGVSSFGFSGTNAHVIIEEPPAESPVTGAVDRPKQVLALSARGDAALRELAQRFAAQIASSPDALADLCYTANTGRSHFEERLAIVTDSKEALRRALGEVAATGCSPAAVRGHTRDLENRGVAFLFTGQGAQYVGMARSLYETQPTFRRALDRCAQLFDAHLAQPLLSVVYRDDDDATLLDETSHTQPALFAIEYALAELWRSWGVVPAAVLGHSIGEYTAACVAGAISLEDAVRLVAARARLMQALPPNGAMASVWADVPRVTAALAAAGDQVAIAAVNGPEDTVIAGTQAGVDAVVDQVRREGIKAQRLAVSHAFHSPLLDPMLDEFERIAASIQYQPARVTFVSNLTGAAVDPGFAFGGSYWRDHARQRVRFGDGIVALHEQGYRTFLEVGPSATLIALGQRNVADGETLWLSSLRRGRGDWDQLLETVARLYVRGSAVDWSGFDREYSRRRVALPTYPFQRERFWIERGAPPHRAPAPTADADRASTSGLLYDVEWIEQPLQKALTPDVGRGRWIILADRGGVARTAYEVMQRLGAECLFVPRAGGSTVPDWLTDAAGAAGILNFWGLDAETPIDVTPLIADLAALFRDVSSRAGSTAGPPVWIVTRGAQPVKDSASELALAQAPAWAFARVAALEHADLWGGLVDLDPRETQRSIESALADLLAADSEDQVAYRNGKRFVARLREIAPPPQRRLAVSRQATYLVTGGTGALGLRVARRLVERGAGHLVLASRSGPPADAARIAQIRALEEAGASVRVVAGDAADELFVRRLVSDLEQSDHPLRGIVHAAGIVRAVPVPALSPEDVDQVLRSKTAGTWFLHEATREIPLDFFVMFSSVASVWGSKGLAAYAAANHYLDAVAHYRRSLGLPALAVNWGPWADGGMTTAEGRDWLAQIGLDTLEPCEALDTLEDAIGSGSTQATVARVDWERFVPVYTAKRARPMLERMVPKSQGASTASRDAAGALRLISADERARVLESIMRDAVAGVLRFAPSSLDLSTPLNRLGLDSLVAVELRNRIQREAGVLLPVVVFLDGTNTSQLTGLALKELEAAAPAPVPSTAVTPEEAAALLGRISELDDEEVERLLQTLSTDSQV